MTLDVVCSFIQRAQLIKATAICLQKETAMSLLYCARLSAWTRFRRRQTHVVVVGVVVVL